MGSDKTALNIRHDRDGSSLRSEGYDKESTQITDRQTSYPEVGLEISWEPLRELHRQASVRTPKQSSGLPL